jgi:protein-tyrosine-phosphatase
MNHTVNPYKILFLCTGNSARSILAEYLLKRLARERFEVYSAGAAPKPSPHPLALRVLKEVYKIEALDAHSKSWNSFKNIAFDFVITLCDGVNESCPIWPGQPILAHWGLTDPAAVEGTEEDKLKAFLQTAIQIQRRLELFNALPLEKLDRLRLEKLTRDIGSG